MIVISFIIGSEIWVFYILPHFLEFEIIGDVDPEWKDMKVEFENLFKMYKDYNSQLVIYHQGKKVVDLIGRSKGTQNVHITHDSISQVWSTGKSVASILMAIMVERGYLKYEEKVTTYWPEFGKNGKGELTVKDVLKH